MDDSTAVSINDSTIGTNDSESEEEPNWLSQGKFTIEAIDSDSKEKKEMLVTDVMVVAPK